MAFLHRLVGACHLTFTQQGTCGIRLVCLFLQRTGLNQFVASSFGSQQAIARQLEQAILDYGASQRRHLASQMTPKPITVCEDETFHPQVCLVSIEPVSDFILLEVYCQGRDATSWTTQLTAALEGLPVEVVQVTSDEAKGLLAHAREGLGAHHSPDLFHVQHEVGKATSLSLRSQTTKPRSTSTAHATRPSSGSSDATPTSRVRGGQVALRISSAASRRAEALSRRWRPGWKPLNSDSSKCVRRSEAWGTITIPLTSPAVALVTRMPCGSA